MIMVHRGVISGGVVIGASAHFVYYPTLAILFGMLAGVTTFFTLRHLQGRFEMGWGVYDTSGVFSYAFFPSMLGAVSGAILLVIYHFQGVDDRVVSASSSQGIFGPWETLQRKGGYLAGA